MKKSEISYGEFLGVFHFTNWTNEDFVHLWNNIEYTFPKKTTTPMIMPKETSESIQEIRKRFAYDLSEREFYKSKEYKKMSKMGAGLPPTFDPKILEPMIQKCLEPLPAGKATIKQVEDEPEKNFKASKAVAEKANVNFEFRDESDDSRIKKLGRQPDSIPVL